MNSFNYYSRFGEPITSSKSKSKVPAPDYTKQLALLFMLGVGALAFLLTI